MKRLVIAGALVLGAIAVIVWLGFRHPAPPDPPEGAGPPRLTERTVLYDGLPPGLQYYLTQTVSRTPYVARTALLWGTGSILANVGPVSFWLPVRWWEAIDVERGYLWWAEVLWWRWPLMHVEDRWVDSESAVRLDDRRVTTPCLRWGQAMRAKAEYVWLPSALVTDPDIAWAARGTWSAVMRFAVHDTAAERTGSDAPRSAKPGGSGITSRRDSLVFLFDQRTRALVSLSGTRSRADSAQTTWSLDFTEWDAPGGLTVPVAGRAHWDDEPYYEFRVRGVAYNVPVEEWLGPGES